MEGYKVNRPGQKTCESFEGLLFDALVNIQSIIIRKKAQISHGNLHVLSAIHEHSRGKAFDDITNRYHHHTYPMMEGTMTLYRIVFCVYL